MTKFDYDESPQPEVDATRLLRSSDRGLWRSIRQHMESSGADPAAAAVGGAWPEDAGMWSILIATRESTYVGLVEGDADYEGNAITSWQDGFIVDWEIGWEEIGIPAAGAFAAMRDRALRVLEEGDG